MKLAEAFSHMAIAEMDRVVDEPDQDGVTESPYGPTGEEGPTEQETERGHPDGDGDVV